MTKYIFTSKYGNAGTTTLAATLLPAGSVVIDTSMSAMPAHLAASILRDNVGQASVVITSAPTRKSICDAENAVRELLSYGYQTGDLLVVFTRVTDIEEFEEFSLAAMKLGLPVCERPVLELDVYAKLGSRTLEDLANDATDYRSRLKQARLAGDQAAAESAVMAEFERRKALAALRNMLSVRADVLEVFDQLTLQL